MAKRAKSGHRDNTRRHNNTGRSNAKMQVAEGEGLFHRIKGEKEKAEEKRLVVFLQENEKRRGLLFYEKNDNLCGNHPNIYSITHGLW